MVNYQLGKIYKIVCRITGEVYVGSTCEPTLAKRLVSHRSAYKQFYENNKGGRLASFQIILRGDYYIDLLENFPCNSSDELRKKEREYYDKVECINMVRPLKFHEDELQDARRNYHLNKEVIREQHRKYRDSHRDEIQEKNKQYREDNRDEIRVRTINFRNENRERVNECKRLSYHKNKNKILTEEEKQRRLELHKINNRNYRIRKAEIMRQMAESQP